MRVSWKWRVMLTGCAAGLCAIYLLNASWLATPPDGTARLIAQRGVAQTYAVDSLATDETCTARSIKPPTHYYIDNTVASIEAALSAEADIVEIDIRLTRDGRFVLFHDNALDCRTDGSGPVLQHDLADLHRLDAGYGYTADNGVTYPLRGKGVGLIPGLTEVLLRFPDAKFLIQIKDGDPAVATPLIKELDDLPTPPWTRLTFFGSPAALHRLKRLKPSADTWSARAAKECGIGYLETGWYGRIPSACDHGIIIVPIRQAYLLWGWPNRFLARMRAHHTRVMVIGTLAGMPSGMLSRLDTPEQLAELPRGFDGLIWTDRISVIGPLLHGSNTTWRNELLEIRYANAVYWPI